MPPPKTEPLFTKKTFAIIAGSFVIHALALRFMGRIAWGKHGFGLWTWEAQGQDTSQLFADPYSFTHIVHGIIFFGILWFFRERISLEWRFITSLLIEIGWELLENSPLVINRFLATTASLEKAGSYSHSPPSPSYQRAPPRVGR